MASQSPHLTDIPQAIRIAASTDAVDPALKQQALDYLTKVKELCEETWQDCLSLYLQGAGAPAAGQQGQDGKEKLDANLRMFCQQVVDTTLTKRPDVMTSDQQQAMYKAIVEFVQTEYVNGTAESGQSFLRNKLSFTIAHLFLNVYPNVIPSFLHPFLALLSPSDNNSNPQVSLLVTHLLREIAQEIHDNVIRSARAFSKERQHRDGVIRDVIRSSGDERLAVEGMLKLAGKGLELSKSDSKWLEATQMALKTLASWAPWVDISVSLTPDTLQFYTSLIQAGPTSLRTGAAAIVRALVAKGIRDPAEKLQMLKVFDLVNFLTPVEAATRESAKEGAEMVTFRATLAGIVQAYGTELIKIAEMPEAPEAVREEADNQLNNSIQLVLCFLSDRNPEVPTAISAFVSDLLRTYKRYIKPAQPQPQQANGRPGSSQPAPAPVPLPPGKRQFLLSVLEVVVKQLEWPEDVEWEIVQDEQDADEAVLAFYAMRQSFRSVVDNIAAIDKTLHTEVVASIVVNTLERLRSQGPSAVPWQQIELAAYLVYTFGEISKSNSRAAFFELPPELLSKQAVKMTRTAGKIGDDSGRSTPNGSENPEVALDTSSKIDYEQYPLTPLGQLLSLCVQCNLASFPHPSVPLQYFEIAVRYVDFWKVKQGAIQPIFEALLDSRGIHHEDEAVRRRAFYLLGRFIKECRFEMAPGMIPIILESLKDMLAIHPKFPTADASEDPLIKATTGKSYFADQLHLFEAAGVLVYLTKNDPSSQMNLLAAIAGPLMAGIGAGVEQYRSNPNDQMAILHVHHHLLALGHFAKGFPSVSDDQVESQPYQQPFKQMTDALLQALDAMKTQRVVRDAARFAFSQFVSAIGSTIAELVPRFVTSVVTEFEPSELADFLSFLSLLMHRLKKNTFETMDMLLLPLLSRIFAVLQNPVTGTDEAVIHQRLQEAYLNFFTALMNSNLEGVFITDRNKPEFENLLSALMNLATNSDDALSQRLAFSFFAKSIVAWGTSAKAVQEPSVFAESAMSALSQKVAAGLAAPSNQHAITKEQRAERALPGYETFVYQRLIPIVFSVPADPSFNIRGAQPVLYEMAMVLRNMVQARGQEGIDFLLNDMLPKIGCPPNVAQTLVEHLRTQQSKDFRKTFTDFIRAMRS